MDTLLKDTCWALQEIGVEKDLLAEKVNALALLPDISEKEITVRLCQEFSDKISSRISDYDAGRIPRRRMWALNNNWLPDTELEQILILEFHTTKRSLTLLTTSFILEYKDTPPGQEWNRLFYNFARKHLTSENAEETKTKEKTEEKTAPDDEPQLDEETRKANQERISSVIAELQEATSLKEHAKPTFSVSWQPPLSLAKRLEKQGIPRKFTYNPNVQAHFKKFMLENRFRGVNNNHLYELWVTYLAKNPGLILHDSFMDTAREILRESIRSEDDLNNP